MDTIANRLRVLRGSEAQGSFAAKIGLKQAIYCHYEKGRNEPSLKVLVRIADTFGVSTDWLLGRTNDMDVTRAMPSGVSAQAS